jgi:hypothetical protein
MSSPEGTHVRNIDDENSSVSTTTSNVWQCCGFASKRRGHNLGYDEI